MRTGVGFALGLLCCFNATLGFAQVRVSLDTSSLVGQPGPFSLDFQLNDGSGTGDGNNSAHLTDFDFDGGAAAGVLQLTGGARGDLQSDVTINETAFLNRFQQQFVPGERLSFLVDLTNNVDAGSFPDQFSFAILNNGVEIQTVGPALQILSADIASLTEFTFDPFPSDDPNFVFPAAIFTDKAYYFYSKGSRYFLDLRKPTSQKTQFIDSPALSRALFSEVRVWSAEPAKAAGTLATVGDLRVWLSLKNKNDRDASFDLRAELLKNGRTITSGDATTDPGLPRHEHRDEAATEVTIPFDFTEEVPIATGDVLSLRLLIKLADHSPVSHVAGVRLYYGSQELPTQLGVLIAP